MKLSDVQLLEISMLAASNIRPGDWIWPDGLTLKPGETGARKVREIDRSNHKITYINPDDSTGTCTFQEVMSHQDSKGKMNK